MQLRSNIKRVTALNNLLPIPTDLRPGKELLDHLPTARRSLTVNIFLEAVRNGATEPLDVMQAVLDDLSTRLDKAVRYANPEGAAREREIETVITDHPAESWALVAHVLAWEAKPRSEREQVKQTADEQYRREWMQGQPPTDKQISYLRNLGYQGDVTSKAQASELIDEILRNGA